MPKDYSILDPVEVADKDEFGQWLAKVTNQNYLPEGTTNYKQKESLLNLIKPDPSLQDERGNF